MSPMAGERAINDTMIRFGYPGSAIAEYDRWAVLLRQQQATLGALVLVCREPATSFSQISAAAFAELAGVARSVETSLAGAFAYDKINYLMLMMVDPHVHFHVLPRYGSDREFAGTRFPDPGWPRVPDLSRSVEIGEPVRAALRSALRERWPDRGALR